MTSPDLDAIIIGAGAAGGVVAEQLSSAGFNVLLLERGRRQAFHETGHNELFSQRTTVLGNAFGPDDRHYVRLSEAPDGSVLKVLPSEGAYNNVAACLGGGTFSYGAMAWRYLPQDFAMRTTYGCPAGSTLDDWPLTYSELEPFYAKAEREIGVSGQSGANRFEGPRSTPYPMPPLPGNSESTLLEAAARRLGWHPFPIPMAINSVAYGGRPACIGCPHCVGFACEVNAKSSTAVTVIPRALATKNCELETGAVARRIVTNAAGRATAVEFFNAAGELVTRPCRFVVVSCSATESPRLLFNSAGKSSPHGLGNNNGWVGRNLQGHAYSGAYGVFDRDVFNERGPGARIACCDFSHGLPRGLKGGAVIANEFMRLPYLFSQAAVPPDVPRWGLEHKRYMRNHYRRTLAVQGPVQEMPVFDCGVELTPELKDAWGIPSVKISGRRHPHDREVGEFIAARCEDWLKSAGAVRTWRKLPGAGVSGGQHQAGTCRMGVDPKTSVVDRFCRIHQSENVYVVDGSVHVNNGGFNPSLTIQAIAYWASAQMIRDWRRA